VRATLAPVSRSPIVGVLARRLLVPTCMAVALLAAVPMVAAAQSPAAPQSLPGRSVASASAAAGLISPAPSGAAASPDVSAPVDSRSGGQSPGVAGAPLRAAIVVVGLGAAAAAGTVVYLRLTRQD
jgi:hypothetical protein